MSSIGTGVVCIYWPQTGSRKRVPVLAYVSFCLEWRDPGHARLCQPILTRAPGGGTVLIPYSSVSSCSEGGSWTCQGHLDPDPDGPLPPCLPHWMELRWSLPSGHFNLKASDPLASQWEHEALNILSYSFVIVWTLQGWGVNSLAVHRRLLIKLASLSSGGFSRC